MRALSPFRRTLIALMLVLAPLGVRAEPRTDMYTDIGLLGVALSNLGYFGNAFSNRNQPSGEYPINSNVEHIYRGGIWVGAKAPDGTIRVSTGAQDANGLQEGDDIREFVDDPDYPVEIWSNSQNSDNYDPRALATQHFEMVFDDYFVNESGNHRPLGVRVRMRALAWDLRTADDFVIIDYTLVNISGNELRDVYLGMWIDTTVGNTQETDPYDSQAVVRWQYWDDMNGAWGPSEWVGDDHAVEGDPGIWMGYEHDDDGEQGLATSWIGYRLLGTNRIAEPADDVPPVSFNLWRFRGVPREDDEYEDESAPGVILPGKYQIMANGDFDVEETQEFDYTSASNWVGLLSTGPFPLWAPNDTLSITYALVAAPDSLNLLANSKQAQLYYDTGFKVCTPPPPPRLEFSYEANSVIISWAPGDSLDADGNELPLDSPLRSPEHHISNCTAEEDFQGYRVYRFQGDVPSASWDDIATVVAEFDKIDGIGYDTGLPPLDENGKRRFVDTNLLNGFPYWYAVTSFSSPSPANGLDAMENTPSSNDYKVYPGPAAVGPSDPRQVGVYPNPYRAGSMFDVDASDPELGRRIFFTNLPARCTIQVFTLNGEVVVTLEHDDPNSGQHEWQLLSDRQRAIASGLYIYAVKDHATGEVQRGKLVIIK